MTDTEPRQVTVCTRCLEPHNPMHCNGHSKGRNGAQCGNTPMTGQRVCHAHGGKSPQALSAAETRTNEANATRKIGHLVVTPVDNPIEELRWLAGEARAWKRVCANAVAELERIRYSTDGGEQIRGEIQLFERAIDRCNTILVGIAKLNIDERIARISEAHVNAVTQAILQGCADNGVIGEQRTDVMLSVAKYLRPSMN